MLANMDMRFTALRNISDIFSFIWLFKDLSYAELDLSCKRFAIKYSYDVVYNELIRGRSKMTSSPGGRGVSVLMTIDEFKLEEGGG